MLYSSEMILLLCNIKSTGSPPDKYGLQLSKWIRAQRISILNLVDVAKGALNLIVIVEDDHDPRPILLVGFEFESNLAMT